MAPVVGVAISFAGVVGRTQHGKVRHLQGEIRTGFAAVNVIDIEVLTRWVLVLVAAAYLASALIRAQHVVAHAPPLRCLQKTRRGDEARRPTIRVTLSPQNADEERKAKQQKRRKQDRLDHSWAMILLAA